MFPHVALIEMAEVETRIYEVTRNRKRKIFLSPFDMVNEKFYSKNTKKEKFP